MFDRSDTLPTSARPTCIVRQTGKRFQQLCLIHINCLQIWFKYYNYNEVSLVRNINSIWLKNNGNLIGDLQQVSCFLLVLQFSLPIKVTASI